MSPLSSLTQTVLESSLTLSPQVPTYHYFDYWGTLVYAFDIHEPHTHLKITSTALVETTPARALDPNVSWNSVHEVRDKFAELLPFTHYAPASPDIAEIAEGFRDFSSPTEAAEAVSYFLQESLTYLPGSTTVHGTALEAWKQKSGVCQDFAHLALAILRYLNIPSRYVSGYLYPLEDAEVGDLVVGASHAWIEVWLGGWYALDPTNGAPVGERHVTVAKGRDYADVKPFAGIYHGGSLDTLVVSVELVRLA